MKGRGFAGRGTGQDRQGGEQKGGSGKNGKDVNSQFSNETDSSNKERRNLSLIVGVHRSWKFKNMFFKSVSQLVNEHLLSNSKGAGTLQL